MSVPAAIAFGALAFCAWGCAGGPPRPEPSPLRPADQIEPEFQALLSAYGSGGEVWEAARASAVAQRDAGDSRPYRFLLDNLVLEMVRTYQAANLGDSRRGEGAFERAQSEVVRFGLDAAPLLVEMVASRDGILAFLGADTLLRMGPEAADAPLELLSHPRDEVRRRAAELLGRVAATPALDQRLRAALAQAMQTDPAWIVRAQAVRAFGERLRADPDAPGWAAGREALERLLADGDPDVSKEAVDAVGALGDRRSLRPLLELWTRLERDHAQDPSGRHADYLRRRAAVEAALAAITKQRRRMSLEAWRKEI